MPRHSQPVSRRREQRRGNSERSKLERNGRWKLVRRSLSGSCVGDYLTVITTKENPRRRTIGSRSRVASRCVDGGPRPLHDPLNDPRTAAPGSRWCYRNGRRPLSGSCDGDYLTVITTKEKPRRQSTGTRLRVALGHGKRGPCPLVCKHDPLNVPRPLEPAVRVPWYYCTSVHQGIVLFLANCHNEYNSGHTHNITSSLPSESVAPISGTSRRRSAFQ